MNSKAYDTFIGNIKDDDPRWFGYSSGLVMNVINMGFQNGMSEIETLRSVVLTLMKVQDEGVQRKIYEVMVSPRVHGIFTDGVTPNE